MKGRVLLALLIAWVAYVLITWIRVRSARQRHGLSSSDLGYERRLRAPNLAEIEAHIGHRLPGGLYALYGNMELLTSGDLDFAVPNPITGEPLCYVAWFEPGDLRTLVSVPNGCAGLFPFANDGSGDRYMLNLRQDDPEVIYYQHESGEKRGIGLKLSEFLSAQRVSADDK